jgi:hypothetical protein
MKKSVLDFITKYLILVHMASTLEIMVSLAILTQNSQGKLAEAMGA